MEKLPERTENLWWLALAPTIWAAHFLLCYITVALWCEKVVVHGETIATARALAVGYTVVALGGIAWAGVDAYRRHSYGHSPAPHDHDTPEDRHRFLGFAGLLLAVVSAIAVVFVGLPFAFFDSCR